MRQSSSDDVRRNWRQMLTDIEEHGEHVGVVRYKHLAAVVVPADWYEQARSALAANRARMKPGGQIVHKDGDIGNNELANLEVVYPEDGGQP